MATDDWTYRKKPEFDDSGDGVDGTVEEGERLDGLDLEPEVDYPVVPSESQSPEAGQAEETPSRQPSDGMDEARVMAIISHMSVLFGVPVFLIPLVQRKNALAIHHAKAACLIFIGFYLLLALSIFGNALFLPVMFLVYLPGIVGVHQAVQGREAGRWGLGDLAESLFPHPVVRGEQKPNQITDDRKD